MSGEPRQFRRTKIVATLGPGSGNEDTIRELVQAGVNVFRVNSSHGTVAERVRLMELVNDLRARTGCYVGLLLDLQGPRIRIGKLEESRNLVEGAEIVFAPETQAQGDEIPVTYAQLAGDVERGSRILMDDGLLEARVMRIEGSRTVAEVVHGGGLKSNKGMNLPGVNVSSPAVTDKDREDIQLGLQHGVDYIGISFVRRSEDVRRVRELVPSGTRLVAKIEKAEALEDIEGIIEAADAIMVARGDLGVELPFEEVPLAQKHLIGVAVKRGKPVITATQMLESMIHNPRPTRAEVSDVANAILDGTDAVMLSAETSVGEYPIEAVKAMVRIIMEIEEATMIKGGYRTGLDSALSERQEVEDAIALATCAAAEMLDVPFIVCFTKSGFTARKIAAYRPTTPILGLSTERVSCNQLALVWGVVPELAERAPDYQGMLESAREVLEAKDYVRPGNRICVTAGVPFDVPGTTNLLKVEVV